MHAHLNFTKSGQHSILNRLAQPSSDNNSNNINHQVNHIDSSNNTFPSTALSLHSNAVNGHQNPNYLNSHSRAHHVINFPDSGVMPKSETEADAFIQANPNFDGRTAVVCIFDTGVDPGADGLQITTDGKPKILDIIDCTGSGDVNTSTIVKSIGNNEITGLTGRKLKLNSQWKNPTGEYHIGMKAIFELFPSSLVSRLKKERKKQFDIQQRVLESELNREIQANSADADKKADLETQLSEIKSLAKSIEDVGPVCDVVVFHDGQNWRVAVDCAETGDLTNAKLLTDYKIEKQYSTFSASDMMNYSVNIYDNGNTVSIVTNAGAHGTHVAGIVSANFPRKPEYNGIAPGAQIISCKIGDSRLGSMETGVGLMRGLLSALQHKVDLINMSYGEATTNPQAGRFMDFAGELINKHGIIFVASAGNSGPALSSVGAPGGAHSDIISVGAYVSPSMMESDYAMRKLVPETQFTWSSRGPTYDGDTGVTISACGGAITSVPNWLLQSSQLMNGTSMSSPAACGGLALLVSALKQQNITFSPRRIRMAIENTAREISYLDRLTIGAGLLQIEKAHTYLYNHRRNKNLDIQYKFNISTGGRGIYIREPADFQKAYECSITLETQFPEPQNSTNSDKGNDSNNGELLEINQQKIDFQVRLQLEHKVNWIECPSHLLLMNNGRSFNVVINTHQLSAGLHFTEICGFDTEHTELGPLFRVPVTVCVPEPMKANTTGYEYKFERLVFQPNSHKTVHRKFLAIPLGATSVELKVRPHTYSDSNTRAFMLHTMFLLPEAAFRDNQINTHFSLQSGEEKTWNLDCVGGQMLEVCLSEYWSTIGDCEADIEVQFHSVSPDQSLIGFDASTGIHRVDLFSALRNESLNPSVQLKALQQASRPQSYSLFQLSERDQWPNTKKSIYELQLTYQFDCKEDTKFIMRVPLLQGLLYDSIYESQLYMIFDSNKRLLHTADSWPEECSLKKGKYIIKMHVRHDELNMLEKLKDMTVLFESQLSKPIDLSIYPSFNAALQQSGKFGEKRTLKLGARKPLFITAPEYKSYPTAAKSGDILVGSITYMKSTAASGNGSKHSNIGNNFKLIVPPEATKNTNSYASNNSSSTKPVSSNNEVKSPVKEEKKKEKDESLDLSSELQQLQIDFINKSKGEKKQQAYQTWANQLQGNNPDNNKKLELAILKLDVLNDSKTNTPAHYQSIIDACNSLLKLIDQTELAVYFGKQHDKDDPTQAKTRKQNEKLKTQLLQALQSKATAAMELIKLDDIHQWGEDSQNQQKNSEYKSKLTNFQTTLDEISEWVNTGTEVNRKKYSTLFNFEDELHQKYGSILKNLNSEIHSAEPNQLKELLNKRITILNQLGSKYSHLVQAEESANRVRFPVDYTPF